MTVSFGKELLRQEDLSKKEKFQVMQRRRARLTAIGKQAIQGLGYELGNSLKVPGSHAFFAKYKGKTVRVGVKTCADRWMGFARDSGGGFGLLDKVDILFVVAFDEWPEPERVQVYQFDPKLILSKAIPAYDGPGKHDRDGPQFIPLDVVINKLGAASKGHVEPIFDELIDWTDSDGEGASEDLLGEASVEEIEDQPSAEIPIMDRIKKMLSEHMGVRPELIEIEVRVKI